VLVQEWLAEAVTMWSFAALVIVLTAAGGGTPAADGAYRLTAGALLVLAVLTALTGARTRMVWFKICPVLLTSAAVLLLVACLSLGKRRCQMDRCVARLEPHLLIRLTPRIGPVDAATGSSGGWRSGCRCRTLQRRWFLDDSRGSSNPQRPRLPWADGAARARVAPRRDA
jgi:hypothetical protein